MNRRYVVFLLFVCVQLFAAVSVALAFRSLQVGSTMPAAMVKDLNGRDIKLELGDRVVVLYFWRGDQSFSLDGLKDLEQIRRDFSGRRVEVLAIAEGNTPVARAQSVAKDLGLSYPVYIDGERKIEEKLGIIVFPSTGIVAPRGQLKFYLPSRNSNFRQIIAARLKFELGMGTEKEFDQQMTQIGEEMGGERAVADRHFKSGVRLSRQGKSQEALQEFKQALALDGALVDAHLALGNAYLDVADAAAAKKEFELVLTRHPNSPGAKLGLGISAVRMGELDKGIELLKDAVQINPDPVQGYYELGSAYEKKGNVQEAMRAYRWAVRKLLQGRR